LQRLNPNTTYSYQIFEGEKEARNGTFTTLDLVKSSDLPEITFATGSCAYLNEKSMDRAGEPFGKSFEVFNSIANKNPDFMLWLGDNIYLRNNEWLSKTGIYRRYTQFKSLKELQPFWKEMSHYAIWDDHDYGPNDADRSFINKDITLQAFKDFWANPSYGIDDQKGISTQFSYYDIDFFFLDNRFNRSPNDRKTGTKEILGKPQIEWLIDGLVNSKANFKIIAVGGQFLSDAKVYENHANYETERKLILELIEKEEIKNIVFLSGDRHKTELSSLLLPNQNVLYDFTCSPLASKAFDSEKEGNTNQVKGTHVATQNFGILKLKGQNENRSLTIETYDSKGVLIWQKEIIKQ
jgi:alkaline phosphatase D